MKRRSCIVEVGRSREVGEVAGLFDRQDDHCRSQPLVFIIGRTSGSSVTTDN